MKLCYYSLYNSFHYIIDQKCLFIDAILIEHFCFVTNAYLVLKYLFRYSTFDIGLLYYRSRQSIHISDVELFSILWNFERNYFSYRSPRMFSPFRWLLRIGGFPENNKTNFYFLCPTMAVDIIYLCITVYNFPLNSHDFTLLSINILDLIDSTTQFITVTNLHLLKQSFTRLVNECLVSESKSARRSEIVTFLVFVSLLGARIISRSMAIGRIVILHEVLMGQFYIPNLFFILVTHHLNVRFSNLNEGLREMAEDIKANGCMPLSHVKTKLNRMFGTHICLRNLLRRTSGFFGTYIAVDTMIRVAFLTIFIYKLIIVLCDPTRPFQMFDVFVLLSVVAVTSSQCDIGYKVSEKVIFSVL